MPGGDQGAGQRAEIPPRLAAEPVHDLQVRELLDELPGHRYVEGGHPAAHPVEYLDEDAAKAEHHQRAEFGLALDAEQRLAAGLEHRLDHH